MPRRSDHPRRTAQRRTRRRVRGREGVGGQAGSGGGRGAGRLAVTPPLWVPRRAVAGPDACQAPTEGNQRSECSHRSQCCPCIHLALFPGMLGTALSFPGTLMHRWNAWNAEFPSGAGGRTSLAIGCGSATSTSAQRRQGMGETVEANRIRCLAARQSLQGRFRVASSASSARSST